MPRIYLDKDDRIVFYGNPAGYVSGTDAVIDPVFQTDEMAAFLEKRQLTPSWESGLYERLAAGVPVEEASSENAPPAQACPHLAAQAQCGHCPQIHRI